MVEPAVLVGTGGMIGAVLRYLVNQAIEEGRIPLGTLTVNVVGSFVLGFVAFLGVGHAALLFVGTGACGSFTTFSTFSVDTVRLWEAESRGAATMYAGLNLVGALVAIGVAWLLLEALSAIPS